MRVWWVMVVLGAAAAAAPTQLWTAVMATKDSYFATRLSPDKLGPHFVCGIAEQQLSKEAKLALFRNLFRLGLVQGIPETCDVGSSCVLL